MNADLIRVHLRKSAAKSVAKFSSLTEVLNLTRQNDVTLRKDQESLDFLAARQLNLGMTRRRSLRLRGLSARGP